MTSALPNTSRTHLSGAAADGELQWTVDQLVRELGSRPVEAMAYATAWAARLAHPSGEPVFPAAFQWLRDHQHPDGSWGGTIARPHDRLVSTLAAVLALQDAPHPWAPAALHAGVAYVQRHRGGWRDAEGETVGFELVAAQLTAQAAARGLITGAGFEELAALRRDKLSRVPADVLARQPTTLLYSMEALEGILPAAATLAVHAGPNGSMADNPPATAALWAVTADPAALAYLRSAAASTGGSGMPETYPIDVFEPAWTLYVLHRGGLTTPDTPRHVQRLADLARTARQGIGQSSGFPVTDSDDTAMVANVLHAHGHDDAPLLSSLLAFETDTHFLGFPHERGAAVSANARVLEALARRPHRFRTQITKALNFLLDQRREVGWWSDKWHLSPYYATAQVAFALEHTAPHEMDGTRQWLLDSQHADGSWGTGAGLPEETAYAVLALAATETHHGPVPPPLYQRAHTYLRQHLTAPEFAELWVGKGLYTPATVVRSTIAAACAIASRKAAS
ncbi:prenyltransferase/squalene oxidase repeat-containing protein [Streptomyces sp. NPDC012765]|uniref:prenyltransferase/squalene oxidase repeat-containing protein n=1 Tax=Streptomyces sp. NPDC012765 TaxID=3155249 RepID=UPI0033E15EE4